MEGAKGRVAKAQDANRVRLTDINPHIVCVLCHGYFVDATTITECLHSFCRSCIFRHLETKSYCPICEVQVHTRLHRSLKADKTLQDIVYKLVPGLFHNEMERRRQFYKMHPHRDEHLEAERRGLGLNRLIYSPTDTISLSLEFYDTEREREEWASVTCPSQQQETVKTNTNNNTNNNNNNKRYLQCPAVFKMGHLKKFIRQKYNLSTTANVEIIYKRESLPDSYSLMDVAYIYTWKRNGPMRFYYRIPDVVEVIPSIQEKKAASPQEDETLSDPFNKSVSVEEKEDPTIEAAKCEENAVETNEENVLIKDSVKLTVEDKVPEISKIELNSNNRKDNVSPTVVNLDINTSKTLNNESSKESEVIQSESNVKDTPLLPMVSSENVEHEKDPAKSTVPLKDTKRASIPDVEREMQKNKEIIESKKEEVLRESNGVQISKQDELPVSVLLSLGKCRVGKPVTEPAKQEGAGGGGMVNGTTRGPEFKSKSLSNGRANLNKIANELQQKAVGNSLQKISKENISQAVQQQQQQPRPIPNPPKQQSFNFPATMNGKPAPPKPKKSNSPQRQMAPFSNNGSVMSVMDQRIQQLYRSGGGASPANKPESRLANWLNNRFQPKSSVRPISPASKPKQTILPRPNNVVYCPENNQKGDNKMKNRIFPHGMKDLISNGLRMDPRPVPPSPFPRIPSPKCLSNGGETHRFPNELQKPPESTPLPGGVSPTTQKSLSSPATPRPAAPPQNPQNPPNPSSKLDEEVSKLKKKLEELKRMNDGKGRDVGGCRITQENPDPEAAKKMRDLTPVVSIELMRGGKRPVPGLKAIQEIVELGKRKGDEKKQQPEKKLKLSTQKKEGDDALDLSRCALPPPTTHPTSTPLPHWFNPLLRQYMPTNK